MHAHTSAPNYTTLSADAADIYIKQAVFMLIKLVWSY